MFPLIQLPRKSEENVCLMQAFCLFIVSINSTSEEVRRKYTPSPMKKPKKVSINSTSEEVRSF